MCSTQSKPHHKFTHTSCASANSSQGHTQHQISLSFRVHVLYISIASLAIAQYHVK